MVVLSTRPFNKHLFESSSVLGMRDGTEEHTGGSLPPAVHTPEGGEPEIVN